MATERFEYAKKIKSAIGENLNFNMYKRVERGKRASKLKVSEDDIYVTLACID